MSRVFTESTLDISWHMLCSPAAPMVVNWSRILSLAALVILLASADTRAQSSSESDSSGGPAVGEPSTPSDEPTTLREEPLSLQLPASSPSPERACDGCPPRRVGSSLLWVTAVNGIYELANLIRGQDTAKITPETWWTNMRIQDRGAARLQLRAQNVDAVVDAMKSAGLTVVSQGGTAVPIPPNLKGALVADPNNFFLTPFAPCDGCAARLP